MSAAHAIPLIAVICSTAREPGRWDACEEAEIRAASCDQAEAWLRAGLRAQQSLRVISCEPQP